MIDTNIARFDDCAYSSIKYTSIDILDMMLIYVFVQNLDLSKNVLTFTVQLNV